MIENLTLINTNSEKKSQSFQPESEQTLQTCFIPAVLIAEVIAEGRVLRNPLFHAPPLIGQRFKNHLLLS